MLVTCLYVQDSTEKLVCLRYDGSGVQKLFWSRERDSSYRYPSVCAHLSFHDVVRGGGVNIMEKLSHPENETCVTPPPPAHYIMEKLSCPEKETCVTPPPSLRHGKVDATCSDITNELVGISGGGNLHIYWPHSNHTIWCVVVLTYEASVSHHTPALLGGVGINRQILIF